MIKDADASNDLLNQTDSVLKAASDSIGWITNDHFAVSNSFRTFNSNDFTVFVENLVNVSV